MGQSRVVVQSHKELIGIYELRNYERFFEFIVHQSLFVDCKRLIHVEFFTLDLLCCPGLLSKSPDSKLAVVEIGDGVEVSLICLLDGIQLDVLACVASDLLFKSHLVRLQIVLFHEHFIRTSSGDDQCFG